LKIPHAVDFCGILARKFLLRKNIAEYIYNIDFVTGIRGIGNVFMSDCSSLVASYVICLKIPAFQILPKRENSQTRDIETLPQCIEIRNGFKYYT
jgi:hypothetical protein